MSQQTEFNDRVVELLEALVREIEPNGRWDEPKHGIEGDPLTNLLHQVEMAKPETS